MAKSTAPGEVKVNSDYEPLLDEANFVEEQLGYPPYWSPAEEANKAGNFGSFYAKLIGFDDSDPEFQRWVFQASHKTLCHKGKVKDQEEIIIEPGGFFSISKYAQLNLALYMDLEFKLTCVEKVDVDKGQMWVWKCQTTPEVHAKLMERRQGVVSSALAKTTQPQAAAAS